MSSSLAAASAALGHPVLFPPRGGAALFLRQISALPKLAGVTAASRLEVRSAPAMAGSGIAEIDGLAGGLPRGCLTEICGTLSSGRSSLMLAALAAATQRGEVCALVDTTDALDPHSAAAAGIVLDRLLWVRCADSPSQKFSPRKQTEKHPAKKSSRKFPGQSVKTAWSVFQDRLDQALRVIDLLLQSGGFGLVAIDFGDVPFRVARRVPLATWFRFQRVIEHTPTVLLVIGEAPCAQTCAAAVIKVKSSARPLSAAGLPPCAQAWHAQLLTGIQIEAELLRSRLERKPMRSVSAAFTSQTRAG